MYGKTKVSNKTRFIITIAHIIIISIIAWFYFGGALNLFGTILNLRISTGNLVRLIILFIFSVVYLIRMVFTLFSFLKREIEWKETAIIIFGISFYQLGFAITGITQKAPIDLIDIIPIALFILGSYLNTYSEFQRKRFKEKPENKGKLYTGGLFKYSQHINYFGDFIWILAFALLTRNLWALIMPTFCFVGFIFFNIPMLNKYLKEKYGEEYESWSQKTKKFIPYIY